MFLAATPAALIVVDQESRSHIITVPFSQMVNFSPDQKWPGKIWMRYREQGGSLKMLKFELPKPSEVPRLHDLLKIYKQQSGAR